MIRRLLRLIAAAGLLGGVGFALAKVLQGRRAGQASMPSGEEPAVPKRSETPLIEPKMLRNLNLKPPGEGPSERETPTSPVIRPQAPATAPPNATALAPTPAPPPATPAPTPAPAPTAGEAAAGEAATAVPAVAAGGPKHWVDPKGSICPASHPVKAKLASKIFHLPGMTAYERTTPDRCYKDEPSAEADGLRKAKR